MSVSAAKKSGDPVRVRRKSGDAAAIEGDWQFVRFEPDSGDMIAEKGGKRVVCSRGECEALNFPGSEEIWSLISSEPDDANLRGAQNAWADLDLSRLSSCLFEYGRGLDPALAGCQTRSDFAGKINSVTEACENALAVLRLDLKRAEAEYNRCPTGTSFENDQKDDLLDRWRGLQEKYAAKSYCLEKLVPVWRHLASCLECLEAARKSR